MAGSVSAMRYRIVREIQEGVRADCRTDQYLKVISLVFPANIAEGSLRVAHLNKLHTVREVLD